MSTKTSIIDVPRSAGESDLFGIERFEDGLKTYIRSCETPLTVALQGEWGSGKTSLMNSLNQDLSGENGEFYSIWVNTWEYALLKDPYSTLLYVIRGLLDETLEVFDEHHVSAAADLRKKAGRFFKKAVATSARIAANTVVDGSGELVDHLTGNAEKDIRIGELRNQLEQSIAECLEKDPGKKGFIFYIDDLDRIDPPVAVQILELLKNIFTIKNCVFVLAIDYDVVVKGLEVKFGKLNELNEREFRSFFDKIIQLPFTMPTSSYAVDEFLRENLVAISFLSDEQANDQDTIEILSEITTLSVGTNPRTLKRLINSISLIRCINAGMSEQDEIYETLVNYALVSIQIAYPSIYRVLVQNPNFEMWDEKLATGLNLRELEEGERKALANSEEFDEEWEQILYRMCEKDPYLKKRALNISRLLNRIRSIIPDSQSTEEVISAIISLSSVTNLEAFDKPLPAVNKSAFLKSFAWEMLPRLKEALDGKAEVVDQQGKRVQSNLFIKFTKKDWGNWLRVAINPISGGLELSYTSEKWVMPAKGDYIDDQEAYGIRGDLEELYGEFTAFLSEWPAYRITTDFSKKSRKVRKHHSADIQVKTVIKRADVVNDKDFQESTTKFLSSFYDFIIKLDGICAKAEGTKDKVADMAEAN